MVIMLFMRYKLIFFVLIIVNPLSFFLSFFFSFPIFFYFLSFLLFFLDLFIASDNKMSFPSFLFDSVSHMLIRKSGLLIPLGYFTEKIIRCFFLRHSTFFVLYLLLTSFFISFFFFFSFFLSFTREAKRIISF